MSVMLAVVALIVILIWGNSWEWWRNRALGLRWLQCGQPMGSGWWRSNQRAALDSGFRMVSDDGHCDRMVRGWTPGTHVALTLDVSPCCMRWPLLHIGNNGAARRWRRRS